MNASRLRYCAHGLICCLLMTTSAVAAEVSVVVGRQAPKLERFAAAELASQFQRLFAAETAVVTQPPKQGHVVYIGSPTTNPHVKQLSGFSWPQVSQQGIVLQSVDGSQPGLVVGGGSPVATMWAVYELGHRFGVRYLLREDLFPEVQPLKLTGLYVILEPQLRARTWRTINDFAIGPESWGIADHRRLLKQLAKLKFNQVMLSVYPSQPFVHYEYGGVQKRTGVLFFGDRYPIESDSPGRTALRGVREFTNPDFAGRSNYQQMTEAGIQHVRQLIAAAHDLGMQVGISISPLEFPREFTQALPGLEPSRGLNNLFAAPGPNLKPDDPRLQELVTTKMRAYVETYPNLDSLYLTLPEFPEWGQHVDSAWRSLAARIGPSAPSLSQLVNQARKRSLIASGDRGERSLKGNIVTLDLLQRLLTQSKPLTRADGKQLEVVITSVDPALFPYLDRVVPTGSATLNFVDYTARRVAENQNLLSLVPANKVRSRLIMTLADDNVGVLSQSALQSMGTLVERIRSSGWDGFSTRYWMLTEQDSAVYYLARAAWDAAVTPRSAHDDLFATITEKQSIADRLWLGFEHIEKATNLVDENQLGFSFPVPGMLLKHYRDEPAPEWWDKVIEHYTQAMIEFYRSNGPAAAKSHQRLFYYAKRSEYVLDYWNCVKAVRAAAIAKGKGDMDGAIEQLETAIEALYNAIDTLGDVAEDQSDRGLIAVLNAYAYRPLLAEYEKLLDE